MDAVHDGVLDSQGDVVAVGEYFRGDGGVHGQGVAGSEVTFPGEIVHRAVELGVGGDFVGLQGHEYRQSRAQAQVGLVQETLVAVERYGSPGGFYPHGAQVAQFLGQDFLQSVEGLGHHLKIAFRHRFCHREWMFCGKGTHFLCGGKIRAGF